MKLPTLADSIVIRYLPIEGGSDMNKQALSDIARKKRIFAQQTDNITKTCQY